MTYRAIDPIVLPYVGAHSPLWARRYFPAETARLCRALAPPRCRAIPPKSSASWINDEQYAAVACRCDRDEHPDDKQHHCAHGTFESYGSWERGETP